MSIVWRIINILLSLVQLVLLSTWSYSSGIGSGRLCCNNFLNEKDLHDLKIRIRDPDFYPCYWHRYKIRKYLSHKTGCVDLFFIWELEKKRISLNLKFLLLLFGITGVFQYHVEHKWSLEEIYEKSGCSIGWLTYRCNICFYIAFWIIEIEKKKAKRMETFKPHLSTYNSYVYLHLYKVIVLYSF